MRTSSKAAAQPRPDDCCGTVRAIAEFIYDGVQAGTIDDFVGILIQVGREFPTVTLPEFTEALSAALDRDGWLR